MQASRFWAAAPGYGAATILAQAAVLFSRHGFDDRTRSDPRLRLSMYPADQREDRVVPTVLRWQGWIFLFYSADWREPPHVHARKGRKEAKFWLSNCSIAAVRRVPQHELSTLQRKARQHRDEFLEKWHAHFGRGA